LHVQPINKTRKTKSELQSHTGSDSIQPMVLMAELRHWSCIYRLWRCEKDWNGGSKCCNEVQNNTEFAEYHNHCQISEEDF